MKKIISSLLTVTLLSTGMYAQIDLNKTLNGLKEGINNATGKKLSSDDVVKGLKEALTVGSNNSTASASKADGFWKNPAIKIPFPPEAKEMRSTLIQLGLKDQVTKFEMTLNRAAEKAAKDAAPIFVGAITSMTIDDAFSILNGGDNAATTYLNNKTNAELYAKFLPVVKNAINSVELTKYWKPLAIKYNKIPGVKKQNPNLDDYVTKRSLTGLFKLVADEELKIRKDPVARISDILKKVFG